MPPPPTSHLLPPSISHLFPFLLHQVVRELVRRGLRPTLTNDRGETPLHLVMVVGCMLVARLLGRREGEVLTTCSSS